MLVFINRVRSIYHQLALINRTVPDEYLVYHVLQGLPSEFNSFKTSVNTKQLKFLGPISFTDLLGLLLAEEARILTTDANPDFTIAYANISHSQSFSQYPQRDQSHFYQEDYLKNYCEDSWFPKLEVYASYHHEEYHPSDNWVPESGAAHRITADL